MTRCYLFLVLFVLAVPLHAATIEFLSGSKLECKVLKKDDASITVEVGSGEKKETRTFKLSLVHKVIINDKTHLINEKPAAGAKSPEPKGKSTKPDDDSTS